MNRINIAIDGPSAAGKSTIAKRLASKLQYIHLDTGAMYRCCAWKANQLGLDIHDEAVMVEMIRDTKIELKPDGSVFLDGNDVSADIRQNEVSMLASAISQHAEVRAELVRRQQEMAKEKGFILDGRDIGSVVLPNAELKIYQTASVETRAKRRHLENQLRGLPSNISLIEAEIRQRDEQDKTRTASPLVQVSDAVHIDTSDMTIEEAVNEIYLLALQRIEESSK